MCIRDSISTSDGTSANGTQIYGDATAYGFLNGTWGNWDLRKIRNGNLYFNSNTTYYLNPNATSKIDTLNVTGTLQVDGANGSSGQVLKSNGSSSPTWADASSLSGVGGWEFVSGVNHEGTTVASTVEFTGLERNRQYKLIIYKWYVDVSDTGLQVADYRPIMQFYNDSYGWNKNAANGTLKFRFESRNKSYSTNTWSHTHVLTSSTNATDGVWLSNYSSPTRNNGMTPFYMEIDFGQHTNADFDHANKYEMAWMMKGTVGWERYECNGETYANDNDDDDTHFSKMRISTRNTFNNFHSKMALFRAKTA